MLGLRSEPQTGKRQHDPYASNKSKVGTDNESLGPVTCWSANQGNWLGITGYGGLRMMKELAVGCIIAVLDSHGAGGKF
jgi:hypothetical protein